LPYVVGVVLIGIPTLWLLWNYLKSTGLCTTYTIFDCSSILK